MDAGSSDDGSFAKESTMYIRRYVDVEVPGCGPLAAIFPFPPHFTQCLLLNLVCLSITTDTTSISNSVPACYYEIINSVLALTASSLSEWVECSLVSEHFQRDVCRAL